MRFSALALAPALASLLLGGCHPLACWHPADLPRDPPLVLQSSDAWPKSDVEINVDELGIPHMYGQSEPDLAFALGVMHARDRQFQILLYIHAGEGRLTELLGADLLEIDRENRLLGFGSDAQLAAMGERDLEIVQAYCAGLNREAAIVGRSAEMSILGVDWQPVTPRDILAVVRLQQWDQSAGFGEEMARYRLVKELGQDSPVAQALLVDASSGGVPIVTAGEHDGTLLTAASARTALHVPPAAAPSRAPVVATGLSKRDLLIQGIKDDLAAQFSQGGTGASNSWSVTPSKTAAGVAVLANDPHLGHSAPGVFYMVDMHIAKEGRDEVVAGGTFPGIPGVLIGHGSHVAWGITNAYADTQDVVVLNVPEGSSSTYSVDGEVFAFGEQIQTFKLGKGDDAEVITETYLTSIFGPVLPPGYGSYNGARSLVDEGEHLALLWTAQQFPVDNARLLSAFWDLAQSKNIDEATAAIQDFASPSMNINLAFTDGTIAYRLSGIIPVRGDEQRVDYPRIGNTRSAGWTRRLTAGEKPQSTNPEKGYIVAANQRIVENDVLSQRYVGFESARPWRAIRIDKRLKQMFDAGKPTTDELGALQQDVTAGDAQELASIYGRHCPKAIEGHDDNQVEAFCQAVAGFDGVYTKDAIALPYARLNGEFYRAVFRAHVYEDLALALAGETFSGMALHAIMKAEDAGTLHSVVLDDPATADREGLDGFVARAAKVALDRLTEEAGGAEGDWRWGKLHTLSLRGPLSSAPVIGFLFETAAREEAGTSSAPRAENSQLDKKMRVSFGAGLRLIAEMTDPPTIKMVNDSGNSGHFGHRHLEDQYPLWSKGEPPVLSMSKKNAVEKREGAMVIKPKS